MKLFIVGPKFGYPDDNHPNFHAAAKQLRGSGHEVVSSAEADFIAGADLDHGFDEPLVDEEIYEFFKRDVRELLTCESVALLDGWDEDHYSETLAEIADNAGLRICKQNGNEFVWFRNLSEIYGEDSEEEFEWYAPTGQKVMTGDSRFSTILRQMEYLHNKKQSDYGRSHDPFANVRASEDFGIPGWVGAVVRANDKMKRLQKFAQGDNLVNESVEDSFLDLAVYSIIGLILFQEIAEGK